MTEEWFDAAMRGDVEILQRLIASGMPIDCLDELMQSALAHAVSRCHVDVIRLLLKHGADPNLRLIGDKSPTTKAAERCCPWITTKTDDRPLKMLIAAGGQLGLREAILIGDAELAQRLCDESPHLNVSGSARYFYSTTYLMLAAEASMPEVVKFLLDRGAEIEADDDIGSTALMHAAASGRTENVALLLDHGADVNHCDWTRQSPLSEAASRKHHEVVNLLLARGAKRNLLESVLLEDVERVTVLLLAAEDPNGGHGIDPLLIRAAECGNAEIVELLFRFGASLDRPELEARALCKAAEHGHAEVVQILLQQGFDPTRKIQVQNWPDISFGVNSKTPLDLARANGHALVVQILESAIANRK